MTYFTEQSALKTKYSHALNVMTNALSVKIPRRNRLVKK